MPKLKNSAPPGNERAHVRLSLLGLVILCLSLIIAGGVTAALVLSAFHGGGKGPTQALSALEIDTNLIGHEPAQPVPPWGELVVREVEVERPEEYVAYEADTNYLGGPAWCFGKLPRERVQSILVSSGLSPEQVARALAGQAASFSPTGSVIHPDDELVFSLAPEVRSKLYRELAHDPANVCMCSPYRLSKEDLDRWFGNGKLNPGVVAETKKLIYQRGGFDCFSDFELMVRRLASDKERLEFVRTLSREPALLVRVCIRPDSDLDKLLGYWDRGVQVKDARPLLESLKRLPGGGTISLIYLLPRSVRERLNTFPLPSKPGDPVLNCHWSTMNFFRDPPDDRLANPAAMLQCLQTNYYRLAKPTAYGDILLVRNSRGEVVHSAVYIADDIVYTKNGQNFSQPWRLARLKDVLEEYSLDSPPQVETYRDRKF